MQRRDYPLQQQWIGEDGAAVAHEALRDTDPRQVGAYRIQERRVHRPEGVVYAAHDAAGAPVSLAVLSSAPPATRQCWTGFGPR